MEINGKILPLVVIFVLSIISIQALGNPAAVYCDELGYEYIIETTSEGDVGYCLVDGNKFPGWDFYLGKVGKEYSYCVSQGYDITTLQGSGSSFAPEYAFCVDTTLSSREFKGISQEELMNIEEKLQDIDSEEIPEQEDPPVLQELSFTNSNSESSSSSSKSKSKSKSTGFTLLNPKVTSEDVTNQQENNIIKSSISLVGKTKDAFLSLELFLLFTTLSLGLISMLLIKIARNAPLGVPRSTELGGKNE